ncbi:MAG: Ig-like domain-containing protein [Candidatus Dormibacteria bacterium]
MQFQYTLPEGSYEYPICQSYVTDGGAGCSGQVAAPGISGSIDVQGLFMGDTDYVSVNTLTVTVTTGATPVTISPWESPANPAITDTITLGAAVSAAPGDTLVTFTDQFGDLLCFADPGQSCIVGESTYWLRIPGTTYEVTATFTGDATYHAASTVFSFTLQKLVPDWSVTNSAEYGDTYGDVVAFTTTFSDGEEQGAPADESGTVTYEVGSTIICTTSAGNNSANCSGIPPAGSYEVTAIYSGDPYYAAAQLTTPVDIYKVQTELNATVLPASTTYPHSPQVYVSITGWDGGYIPGLPTGTITVTNTAGGQQLCQFSTSAGGCKLPTLAAGHYDLAVTYPGDANYDADADNVNFVVDAATASFTPTSVPAAPPYGQPFSLQADFLPTAATGTVTFLEDGTTLCTATVSDGSAACTPTTDLPAGGYVIDARYSGDGNYFAVDEELDLTIQQVYPSMSLAVNPAEGSAGQQITLTAGSLPADAAGSVEFMLGSNVLCGGAPVSDGTAICTAAIPAASLLPPGNAYLSASYTGDNNYEGAQINGNFTVLAATSFSAGSDVALGQVYGSAVTLSAGGFPSGATGTVTFTAGQGTLCSATLSAGGGSCDAGVLGAGGYSVTATYSGDTTYGGSTETTGFTIAAAPLSVRGVANPSDPVYAGSLSLVASYAPTAVTGSIIFVAASGSPLPAGTELCSASASSGSASCATGVIPAGTYSVTASYSGDGNHQGTGAFTFAIAQAETSVTASADPTSTPYGGTVTLSASGLPSDATGTVRFTNPHGNLFCATGQIVAGATSCTTGGLPAADYSLVTATYSGDSDYLGATATTAFTITQATTSFTASANPVRTGFGNVVELSASGLPGDAIGTVSFTEQDGNPLCTTGQISAGAASCTTAELAAAEYAPVTATYGGDSNYLGSTATTEFTITRAATSFTASAEPSSTTYGNTVTLSATELPAGATGTVGFTDQDGNPLCTTGPISGGAASCTTAELAPGDFSAVTATYSGDSDYLDSTATTEFTVTRAATSVTASADPTSTTYGNTVDLSASGLPSGATGTVSFADQDGNALCTTGQLSAGAASCTSAELPAADYPSVAATYSGDTDYLGSTATTAFTITRAATSVTASADPTSTTYGDTVTLSASDLPAGAGGTVSFTDDDGNALCTTGQISGGAASCVTAVLSAGDHSPVTASYAGDANHLGSTATTAFTISRAATSLTASAGPSSTTYGNTVTLSVTGLPAAATGTVAFTDQDGNPLCSTGQISAGVASCTTAELPAGDYSPVTAAYPGDANFLGSTATTGFTIAQAATSLTASAGPARTTYGNTVTLSASGLPVDATGTVAFTDQYGDALCTTGQVSAGAAACTTAVLPAAGYPSVTATYSGDSDHLGSTATTEFTVYQAATSLTASADPASTSFGNTVTLSASGLPGDATGTVGFTDQDGNVLCTTGPLSAGAASCTTAKLPAGDYSPVTATYVGDGNYLGSTALTGFAVTADPVFQIAMSGPPGSIRAGGSYTLTSSAILATVGGPADQDPTLTLQLPAGETFTQDAPSSWRCSVGDEGAELICTSTAAVPVTPGSSLGSVAWTVRVAETASGTLITDASLADPGDQAATAVGITSVTVTAAGAAGVPDTGAPGGPPLRWYLLGALLCALGTLLLLWRRRIAPAGSDSR